METNIKLCPEKICRTCLCESVQMRSLNDKIQGENRTILEMLGFVANINVLVENRFPNQVCNECESILCKADAFKRRCLESEAILSQQLETEIQGQIIDEFSKNSVVKDEKSIEIKGNKLNRSPEPYDELEKPVSSSLNDIFDSLANKNEKLKIFADLTISKHKNKSNEESKSALPDGLSVKVVKVEVDQNDMPFDYDDSESYETLPIEFKEEQTKDAKEFTCSCGTVCENKDDYRLHLFTTNCSGFKTSRKVKHEKKNNINRMTVKKIVCPVCKEEFNTVKACKIHQRKHTKEDYIEPGHFECSMCMRKFNRKSAYTNHMKNHEAKSKVTYICDTCKREFRHKAHLDNHILAVHTRDKGYSCDICMNAFTTEASLETHKESHKVEKKHICEICKKAFYMLSTLNDHLRVHTGEKPYLCSICGKGFSQKTNLAQHVRRHQGLKPFKCEDCDRRFVSKGELTAHSRSHSGAHPFVCEDCGSGFTTSSSLVKHRRTHTGERPYACDLCPMRFAASAHSRSHSGAHPFVCEDCGSGFTTSSSLVKHRRTHTGKRPYACDLCPMRFAASAHIRSHSGAHPFVCEDCGSGFTTSSSLVKHRRTHTGERPYACDLCPMRFAASGTLKNHRRTHTGEKPFQCSYCEKAFVQRHDLIAHIRGHTGERPYTCGCGQAFRKASALKAHVRLHGKEPQRDLTLLQPSTMLLGAMPPGHPSAAPV